MQKSSDIIIQLVLVFSIALFAIGLLFFMFFIAYNKKLKRRQKEAISNLILGQKNERERIARDLHDGMVPEMSSIISVMEEIEIKNSKIIEIKKRAIQKLTDSIEAIRQLSHDLMPETLNKHGLIFALRDFLGQKSGKEITIYFTDNTYDIAIENEMAFHLYKITQELIHNSFKYSGANEINVAIFYERIKKQLLYTYDDNGKGFDILKQSDGIGLKNIKTRTTLMNGKLVMDGTQGFSLSITLNL